MKKSIAIIGGGASAIAIACMLNEALFNVTIYEKNTTLGRKFLVAGSGGLNLTHSEEIEEFGSRYTPQFFMKNALLQFTNNDFRQWFASLGITTYIGSSKRVFPAQGIKPIVVLNALLKNLEEKKVTIKTHYTWHGFTTDNTLEFKHHTETKNVKADFVVFCLGGSSWAKTGSDGTWANFFTLKEIQIIPFISSNCAYQIHWPKSFIEKFEGKPVKNCTISCAGVSKTGEFIVTQFGLEGGAIYALSPQIRTSLLTNNKAQLILQFKPTYSEIEIFQLLKSRQNKSISTVLKETLKLSEILFHLLKSTLTKDEFVDEKTLAHHIAQFSLTIIGFAPLDEAISTAGGIDLNEVDSNFEFIKMPNHFAIGEMLNWDAPTGGYLLQGCFSMAKHLANYLNDKESVIKADT